MDDKLEWLVVATSDLMTAEEAAAARPPNSRPRCALRIGFAGHRPGRLTPDSLPKVEIAVAGVLQALIRAAQDARVSAGGFYSEAEPLLTCIAGMAEGADRIAARQAIATGMSVAAILPFSRAEYVGDFVEDPSRREFHDLLAQCASIVELPGTRAEAQHAYRVAGSVLLDQADILISVWDGGASGGPGGTKDILDEAARRGIPAIIIAVPSAQASIRWRDQSSRSQVVFGIEDVAAVELAPALNMIVDMLLKPPEASTERAALTRYLTQPEHAGRGRTLWLNLMRFAGSAQPAARAMPLLIDEPANGQSFHRLTAAFSAADRWANFFSDCFRSAYALNFILAALTVMFAVGPLLYKYFLGHHFYTPVKVLCIVAEIALIAGIYVNTRRGRRGEWHRRWLECRELAERTRPLPLLWRLASRGRISHTQERTWTGWYARALTRETMIWSGRLDKDELAQARAEFLMLTSDQRAYHKATVNQYHAVEHSLESAGFILFLATFVVAVAFFFLWLFNGDAWLDRNADFLTAVTAALPAIGSAIYGLRLIGDFRSSADRSEQAATDLATIVASVEQKEAGFERLRQDALASAEIMLGEVASWRLSAESRPLDIPS